MDLLKAWARWKPGTAPFFLEEDREHLAAAPIQPTLVTNRSLESAIRAHEFGKPGDSRIHLGLYPQPFLGDVRHASIYILLLNPGLGHSDYFLEHISPDFRRHLLATIRQRFRGRANPFIFLDPQFSGHGGFSWWNGKLAGVMELLASHWDVPFAEARQRLGSMLASIELFPYHSGTFKAAGGLLRRLPSVQFARTFVRERILPRARRGQALLIVTRQAKAWGIEHGPGVIVYGPGEARGAHLTPTSRGGKAILRHLGVRG